MKKVRELSRWVALGKLKVKVDRSFKLEEAAAAHEYMAGRGTKGKVVLVP